MSAKKDRQNQEWARVMARAWWDSFPEDARPTGNFIGLAKMLERNLDAGWDYARLRHTMLTKIRSPRVPTAQRIADAYMVQTNNDRARDAAAPQTAASWHNLTDAQLRERWMRDAADARVHAEIVEVVRSGRELPWPDLELPYFARVAVREARAEMGG